MKPLAFLLALLAAAAAPAHAAQPPGAGGLPDRAMLSLGGVPVNLDDAAALTEARTRVERMMAAGDLDAQSDFALMLEMGWGGPADRERSRRLLAQAAAGGSMTGNLALSDYYDGGMLGYPLDHAASLRHLRAAAELADPRAAVAQWRLGTKYLEGAGVTADPAEAHRWIVRAAEAGEPHAMATLGGMLATGRGVAEDDIAARDWYRRSSESGRHGFEEGLRGLGWMMVEGEGGETDLATGLAYLAVAASAGSDFARELFESLRPRITPDLQRQLLAIGDRWIESHMPGH